jgi:transposase InsO family protein
MDYIEQLPPSNGYNSILVIVDRIMKQAIFIPCYTTDKAIDLAKQYVQHVFSKHGVPFSITSDRGKLFVSEIWKEICDMLDIKLALSTAYHPETDGQTERVNQILEQYLQCYVAYLQDDWSELLPLAEFAYNNTPQDSIGMTPFFANKGYHPVINVDIAKVEGAKAPEIAQDWTTLNEYLKKHLQQSFD